MSILSNLNLVVWFSYIFSLPLGSTNEDVLLAVECLDRMMRKRRQVGCPLVYGPYAYA